MLRVRGLEAGDKVEKILQAAKLPIDWVVDRTTGEKRLSFSKLLDERRAAVELIEHDFIVEAV